MLRKNMEVFEDRNPLFIIIIAMICICSFVATPVKADILAPQILQGVTVTNQDSLIEDADAGSGDEVYASFSQNNSALIEEWEGVIAQIRTEYWDYNEERAL